MPNSQPTPSRPTLLKYTMSPSLGDTDAHIDTQSSSNLSDTETATTTTTSVSPSQHQSTINQSPTHQSIIHQNNQSRTDQSSAINQNSIATILAASPHTLILNDILIDDTISWQVHNCKISDLTATQDEPLAFLYHYDALPDEIKATHPLSAELLKYFQTPMQAKQVANLLHIDTDLIKTPWQIKLTGTLVMFSEKLQIALRLKFTNTAKPLDAIYAHTQEEAIKLAIKNWHFYGDVFLLNKSPAPLLIIDEHDNWIQIAPSPSYQLLSPNFTLSILAQLEAYKDSLLAKNKLSIFDDAIKLRLG